MPNENCLANMKCPDCGSEGPFLISATCWALVKDDGVEGSEDYDWSTASNCICESCGNDGKTRTVKQYQIKK